MLNDIDIASNDQFHKRFKQSNLLWLVVAVVYITTATTVVLSNTPAYLHDWRGAAIIGLSVLLLVIYGLRIATVPDKWPPRLRYALSIWISFYFLILFLSLIDRSLAWDYYFLLGISFALFGSYRLILVVSIIMVTLFSYQGLLSWPLPGDNLVGIIGEGIGFFAMTFIGLLSQFLIGERYERNNLLQKLTRANAELAEAHRQLAQSVVQEQELAVLRERTRLAREMHDTLGYALVLVSVKLEAAQRLLERDPQRCERELEEMKEVVRGSMKDLRASIANLRSPALERETAYLAISHYAQEMARRTGIRVSYELDPGIEDLPSQVEETLWKVGHEALSNVEKHANARNVLLHISRQNTHILMRIQDDGVGLPMELCKLHEDGKTTCSSPEGHYGLSGMFERVENSGGHISMHGRRAVEPLATTGGTTVEVELPLVESPH
jgi:signal transduction histidine kinase